VIPADRVNPVLAVLACINPLLWVRLALALLAAVCGERLTGQLVLALVVFVLAVALPVVVSWLVALAAFRRAEAERAAAAPPRSAEGDRP
jgi:hypothetical protein